MTTTDATGRTANLSDLYQTMLARHGSEHPLTQRALSDARHAGVVIAPYVLTGGPIPEDDTRAYRGMVGEAVGNRAVTRDDLGQTTVKIRAARALAGLVVSLLILTHS